jgi:hypothetical protein
MQIHFDYNLKWVFKDNTQYAITTCRKVINTHRGTIVKKTLNGGSIGWWIAGKFIPQSKANNYVELIKYDTVPF